MMSKKGDSLIKMLTNEFKDYDLSIQNITRVSALIKIGIEVLESNKGRELSDNEMIAHSDNTKYFIKNMLNTLRLG